MSNQGSSVSNDWAMGNSFRICSSSIITDLRYKTIIVIGVVVDMLDASIRKVDRVRPLYNTSSII